jgi:DNA-binding NarL/FixJ family response regulator
MDGTGTQRRAADLLLERDGELATIDGLLAAAAGERAGLAVVEGRAGIGKSRLLMAARDRAAAAGFRVVTARGTELEREFPYGAVRQLFEPLRSEPELWGRVFAGAAAGAQPVFEAPIFEAEESGGASFGALHGLYWLTANLSAESPLAILVDDLHWIDAPSLRFLSYLAPRLEGLPVLVIAGVRAGEQGVEPLLMADLVTGPTTAVVSPGPLSTAAVRGLLEERLGEVPDTRFVAACEEATGGNPLLLGQLISSLASENVRPTEDQAAMVRAIGPRAVSRTVLLRLARLDESAAAVARAVAILGESSDLRHVAGLSGLDEPTVAAATAALARADILRAETPLGFVHPLIRAAIYSDIAPAERELQHARAAQLLREAGADSEHVAAQLLQSPRRGDGAAVELLTDAANRAVSRGAVDSAVAYLERALAEPAPDDLRPRVLLELAALEKRTNGVAALGHMREAYADVTDPHERAALAFEIGFLHLFTGTPYDAARLLDTAIPELPEGDDHRLRLEGLELALVWFAIGDRAKLDKLREFRGAPRQGGFGTALMTAYAGFDWALRCGSAEESATIILEGTPVAKYVHADEGLTPVAIGVALTLAERDEVEAHWQAMSEATREIGSVFGTLGVRVWRGWTLLQEGELEGAERELLEGREQQMLWGAITPAGVSQAIGAMASIFVEQGRLAEARELIDGEPHEEAPTFGGLFRDRAEVELLLAERRYEEALARSEEMVEKLEGWMDNPALSPWHGFAGEALGGLGRTDEGLEHLEAELIKARRFGAPRAIGRALRVRGTLRREEGLDDLREAVDLLSGSRARLDYAKALAALGAALRRNRQPTEAREPLRRALELAAACGAGALESEVRSELAAAGVKPRATALGGVESLTASERRVTALAAEGQTNRDIAQELYVTPKTVEVHLSNAYRKLGIRSRRELAAALQPA